MNLLISITQQKMAFLFVPFLFAQFVLSTVYDQGKEINLFQPAREFIPMINEVCGLSFCELECIAAGFSFK